MKLHILPKQAPRTRILPAPQKAHRQSLRILRAPKRQPEPTPERIVQMAWGYAPPLILETALHYRVFDWLDERPQTAEELAARTGASVRGLKAILDALVGLEFLGRQGNRYLLTAESQTFLVSSKPAYHGAYFMHMTRQLIPRWLRLTEAVRTGRPVRPANQEEEGATFFSTFVESLFPLSYAAARRLGEHLGIAKAAAPISVLDIGAGSGVWGIALAHQSPRVKIRAVDWPAVLEVTRKVAQRQGVADRLQTAPGDLLEADFGKGHQIATVGHVLHSEGPGRSRRLLKRIYAALAPGGTIAISEFTPNEERTGPPNALIFAVNMVVNTEAGDTFTAGEIFAWLREAGFVRPRLLEAPAPSPLVLAAKPA
jgi:2-polyprenyl-3-methyl-5-hydroxy-6-metoxy-1,4-benzoquinol methylase